MAQVLRSPVRTALCSLINHSRRSSGIVSIRSSGASSSPCPSTCSPSPIASRLAAFASLHAATFLSPSTSSPSPSYSPPSNVPKRRKRIMAEFAGKYKLTSTDNFDEYMKALGVGLVTRKMANAATPIQEITVDGDQFTIKTSTTFKTTEIKFKLNEEFEEQTADGRTCKTTVTRDGNKLIQEQRGEKPSTIVREFEGTNMKMVLTVGDVVCTRVYAKE